MDINLIMFSQYGFTMLQRAYDTMFGFLLSSTAPIKFHVILSIIWDPSLSVSVCVCMCVCVCVCERERERQMERECENVVCVCVCECVCV